MTKVAKLYGIRQSHSVLAARLMLERVGVEYRLLNILPGAHPLVVRAAGFTGSTVPALRLGKRRIVGSLAISRALDEIDASRALFPRDPERRAAVEAAERWGHDELQESVRRIFQWAGVQSNVVRTWLAREVMRAPAPRIVGHACRPVFFVFARFRSDATGENVRRHLAELPSRLDQADRFVGEGVIGGDEPNVADCQILASLRLLMAFDDLRPLVETRPCGRAALALVPHFPDPPPRALPPIPSVLPREWLPTAVTSAGAR